MKAKHTIKSIESRYLFERSPQGVKGIVFLSENYWECDLPTEPNVLSTSSRPQTRHLRTSEKLNQQERFGRQNTHIYQILVTQASIFSRSFPVRRNLKGREISEEWTFKSSKVSPNLEVSPDCPALTLCGYLLILKKCTKVYEWFERLLGGQRGMRRLTWPVKGMTCNILHLFWW